MSNIIRPGHVRDPNRVIITCNQCACQFYVTGKAWDSCRSYDKECDSDYDSDDYDSDDYDYDSSMPDYSRGYHVLCEWPGCGYLISITKNQYDILLKNRPEGES
jgi:hypothetical protein